MTIPEGKLLKFGKLHYKITLTFTTLADFESTSIRKKT